MARGSIGLARVGVAVTAALASAGLVLAAVALAGGPIGGVPAGGLYYYVGSSSLSVGGTQGRLTICSEPGSRVIGGGFDSDTASADGFVARSTPEDAGDNDTKPDDGWYTEVRNISGVVTNFSSYAICSFDAVKYREAEKVVRAGKTGTVKVGCPTGTRGTAGGLADANSNGVRMSALYPFDDGDSGTKLDDGWAVKATNSDASSVTVTARAVCAAEVKMRYIDDFGGLAHIEPDSTLNLSATICDTSRFVTGGGSRPAAPLSAAESWITAMVPADTVFDPDSVPNDRLVFEQVNDSPATEGDLHLYTACIVRG